MKKPESILYGLTALLLAVVWFYLLSGDPVTGITPVGVVTRRIYLPVDDFAPAVGLSLLFVISCLIWPVYRNRY